MAHGAVLSKDPKRSKFGNPPVRSPGRSHTQVSNISVKNGKFDLGKNKLYVNNGDIDDLDDFKGSEESCHSSEGNSSADYGHQKNILSESCHVSK